MSMSLPTRHHRRGRLLVPVCMALAGLLAMGSVQAQWKVVDDAGNKHLQKIRDDLGEKDGNVNKNLVNLYNQQKIGNHKSAGDMAQDPEEKLDTVNPSGIVIGIDKRCPSTSATGIAQQQNQICQELAKTELAQYKYSLKMYQQAKDRYQRLKEIQDELAHLNPQDQGKLQDNSNKLLALLSLMEIDRQQQKTYMDAYEARLRYLHSTQDLLTRWALEGDPEKKASPWSGWIGDAALKIALDQAKTKRN